LTGAGFGDAAGPLAPWQRQSPGGHPVPHVTAHDGVKLYYEEVGVGLPIVFVHEFAGDRRSYEPQMRHFARRYRCVAYNARGYPPSDVPAEPASYSQEQARDDILAILDGLGLERAHVVGISMGGFATLHFGLRYPERARSLVVAGCGYGTDPGLRAQFQEEAEAAARRFETLDLQESARAYALGPTRVQYQNKDPRGWEEFRAMLAEHSALGSALTLRGVQKLRPSLYDLIPAMREMTVPTLIMSGDEDDPCLEASLMMKRTIPSAALAVLPRTGHGLNLEEPVAFNTCLSDFFHQVEAGRWTLRDPRSLSGSIL
jgi:pimeloyl-ACP methyl ester carboxylesterase